MQKKKIGILISGRGTNMMAIIRAVQEGRLPDAEIAVVISDREKAHGLNRARELGICSLAIPRVERTRESHEADIIGWLQSRKVDIVCMAGYLRLMSSRFVDAFRGHILNIHPSLLPAFPGLGAQRQALAAGVKWSGCTVHFVDERLDGGPIITQRLVEVQDDDTEESLSQRILVVEHLAYIEALELVLSGNYEVQGQRVLKRAISHVAHS